MDIITKPNKKPHNLSAWLTDPYLWVFSIVLIACYFVSSRQSGEWTSNLILISCVSIAGLIVLFLIRRQTPPPVAIPKPALECGIMFGWYAAFMVGLTLTKAEGIFADEFAKWLWFIIIPLILLFIIRRRSTDIRALLRSVGFHRQGIGKALLVALLAYAVMLPSFPFMLPYAQLQKLEDLFHTPLKAILLLPVAFLLSLLTAAFTEEIFFRGIMQPRLTRVIRSEMRACLITALLFGLYHLPYAYYLSNWATHGNFTWALSSVLVEQMTTGLILGILWVKTRNIAAPILFHALVDTVAIMTMIAG